MAAKAERAEVEILDRATNATVVRLPWRRFPGIVIQGDTLNGRRTDLREAIDALRANDAAAALDALVRMDEWMGDLLSGYESALSAAGIDLPYAKG